MAMTIIVIMNAPLGTTFGPSTVLHLIHGLWRKWMSFAHHSLNNQQREYNSIHLEVNRVYTGNRFADTRQCLTSIGLANEEQNSGCFYKTGTIEWQFFFQE